MKWFAMRLLARFVSLVPFRQRPREGFRALMYHSVGGQVEDDALGLFSISEKVFSDHIKLLADQSAFLVLRVDCDFGEKDNVVMITFDDGYLDNLRTAAPLLVEYKIPFTVFVVSDFVKNYRTSFLTPQALRELDALPGATIGAHGKTHVPLAACNDKELKTELTDSKNYLQDVIGRPVRIMSYPYGSVNHKVVQATKEAGFERAFTSYYNINSSVCNALALSRTGILRHDYMKTFRQKINGDWDWMRFGMQNPAKL